MFSTCVTNLKGSKVSDLYMYAVSQNWDDVISMAGGEPLFSPDTKWIKGIEEEFCGNLNKYPSFSGENQLKKLIKQMLHERNVEINEDEIYVVPGGASAVYTALLTLINKDDEVLIQDPCWEHYPNIVRLAGGTPKTCSMISRGDHNSLNIDELKSKITEKTKVLMINSPLNPSGDVIRQDDLKEIVDITAKKNIYIIFDAEYEDYIYDTDFYLADKKYNNMICVHSFSKGFALTGLRIGFVTGSKEMISQFHKASLYSFMYPSKIAQQIVSNALISDWKNFLNSSNNFMKEKRDYLYKRIMTIPALECVLPEAGLYLFISIANLKMSGNEFCNRLLMNQHLVTVPGEGSGNNGSMKFRIFIGLNNELLDEAVDRIRHEVLNILKEQANE